MSKRQKVNTTAIATTGNFSFAIDDDDEEDLPPTKGESVPFISFYHSQQGRADDVAAAVDGSATIGMPWISADGTYYRASTNKWFLIQKPFYYWCTVTDENMKEKVWTTPQETFENGRRRLVDGLKVQESVIAVAGVLGVGKHTVLPVIVDLIKGTQSRAFKQHYDEVRNSMKPENAARFGEVVGAMEPLLRVMSTFKVTEKAGRYPYAMIDARSNPATTVELEKINAWRSDEEAMTLANRVIEEFRRRVSIVKGLV